MAWQRLRLLWKDGGCIAHRMYEEFRPAIGSSYVPLPWSEAQYPFCGEMLERERFMVKWSEGDLCGEGRDGLDCTLLAKVHAESPTRAASRCTLWVLWGANASALNASTNVTTAILTITLAAARQCDGRWTAAPT